MIIYIQVCEFVKKPNPIELLPFSLVMVIMRFLALANSKIVYDFIASNQSNCNIYFCVYIIVYETISMINSFYVIHRTISSYASINIMGQYAVPRTKQTLAIYQTNFLLK